MKINENIWKMHYISELMKISINYRIVCNSIYDVTEINENKWKKMKINENAPF